MQTIKLKSVPRQRVMLQPFEASLPATFPLGDRQTSPLTRTATLKEWLLHWLDDIVAVKREPTTTYCYKNIINRHLVPALGRVRLCDLTPALIQSYYDWVGRNKHLSSNTVRKHHILLHTSLQLAYQLGVLPNNPVDRVEPPKISPARQSFYNPDQLSRLLDLVEGDTLELPVKLASYLGLRRSEITGLRWCDVDLIRGTLSIRQVRTAAGHQIVCKAPKTTQSMRTLEIACNKDLMDLLAQQRRATQDLMAARGLPWSEDMCVVLDRSGKPLHPNQLTLTFTHFIESRDLPKVTLHGLRHTFASVANDARVPMYQISKALGHSDPTITARIYTHLFDQTHGEVLSAVAQSIPRS